MQVQATGFPSMPYTQKLSDVADGNDLVCRCNNPKSGFGLDPLCLKSRVVTSRCGRGKSALNFVFGLASTHMELQTSIALSTKYPIESPILVPRSIKVF